MDAVKRLSDRVAVGAQPEVEDFARLQDEGFRTVVNLRTTAEASQSLSPQAEAQAAAARGLAYHHVPVSTLDLKPEQIEAVRQAIRASDGPVYVHCGGGQRACAFALLAEAEGVDGTALMASARDAGFPIVDDRLKDFVMRIGSSRRPGNAT